MSAVICSYCATIYTGRFSTRIGLGHLHVCPLITSGLLSPTPFGPTGLIYGAGAGKTAKLTDGRRSPAAANRGGAAGCACRESTLGYFPEVLKRPRSLGSGRAGSSCWMVRAGALRSSGSGWLATGALAKSWTGDTARPSGFPCGHFIVIGSAAQVHLAVSVRPHCSHTFPEGTVRDNTWTFVLMWKVEDPGLDETVPLVVMMSDPGATGLAVLRSSGRG